MEKAHAKMKAVLLSSGEELINVFGPVQYNNFEGALILTNERLIFATQKGHVFKSFEPKFSLELIELTNIREISKEEMNELMRDGHLELGSFKVSSSDTAGLSSFYNRDIFSQIQKNKGLVQHDGNWVTRKEKASLERQKKRLSPEMYIDRALVEEPFRTYVKTLAKKILNGKGNCCVCGKEDVALWIVEDTVFPRTKGAKGTPVALHARLLCEDHKEKWMKGKETTYDMLNGVTLLRVLYYLPAEIETINIYLNMSIADFWNMLKSYCEVPRERQLSLSQHPRGGLLYESDLESFLKSAGSHFLRDE